MLYDNSLLGVILPFGLYYSESTILRKWVGYASLEIGFSNAEIFSSISTNNCFIKQGAGITTYNPAPNTTEYSGTLISSSEELNPIVIGSLFKHYTLLNSTYYVCLFQSGVMSTIEITNGFSGAFIRSRDSQIMWYNSSDYGIYKRNTADTWSLIATRDGSFTPKMAQLLNGYYYYSYGSVLYRNDTSIKVFTGEIIDFYINTSDSVVLTSSYLYYLDSSFNIISQENHGTITSHSTLTMQGDFVAINFSNKIVVLRKKVKYVEISKNSSYIALLPNY